MIDIEDSQDESTLDVNPELGALSRSSLEDIALASVQSTMSTRKTLTQYGDDKRIVLAAVGQNGMDLRFASPSFRNDRDVVLAAVQFMSSRLQNDDHVVRSAILAGGSALYGAHPRFRDDKEIMILACQSFNGLCLASERLQRDKEVVLAAVFKCPQAIRHASHELRHDKDIMLQVVRLAGSLLASASPELCNDKQVVLEAVKNEGNAILYASEECRSDKEILLASVTSSPLSLAHMPADCIDADLLVCALQQKPSVVDLQLVQQVLQPIHRLQASVRVVKQGTWKGTYTRHVSHLWHKLWLLQQVFPLLVVRWIVIQSGLHHEISHAIRLLEWSPVLDLLPSESME